MTRGRFFVEISLPDSSQTSTSPAPRLANLPSLTDIRRRNAGHTLRHRMPDPAPDYIFSNVKPWKLRTATGVGFPQYGDDLVDEIEAAGLSDQYEQLCSTKSCVTSGPCLGEILGRFSDLNGDMRKEASDKCGGKPTDWRALWKVFSSYDSGLVISDFHVLHGMIQERHLKRRDFSKMFTTQSNG